MLLIDRVKTLMRFKFKQRCILEWPDHVKGRKGWRKLRTELAKLAGPKPYLPGVPAWALSRTKRAEAAKQRRTQRRRARGAWRRRMGRNRLGQQVQPPQL